MTARILTLLVTNGLMTVLGAGLLPLMRLARSPREVVVRLPLAYAVGLVATGVLAAELAVVHVPVGRLLLPILAAAAVLLGGARLRHVEPAPAGWDRRLLPGLPSLAVLGVAVAFLVAYARLFAVKPLFESDGWAIWGTRARALYVFGHPTAPVFTSTLYPALQHPLWLPALEALDFRFLGRFDGSLAVAQLFGLALALVGGGWVLLRRHAPPIVLAGALLAIVTTPTFLNQLPTNFADVPLAVMMALGLASLAAWLRTGEAGLLPAAVLFLGGAELTKNEGEVFVLAALVAAAVVARRPQRWPLGLAALTLLALDLPWRIWVQLHHVKITEYSLTSLFSPGYLRSHSFRVHPAVDELLLQIRSTPSWSHVVAAILAGLCAAVLLRQFRIALFAAVWLVLSFAGLVAIYWISRLPLSIHLSGSSDRTIDSLVIGGALLVPVLLGKARSGDT